MAASATRSRSLKRIPDRGGFGERCRRSVEISLAELAQRIRHHEVAKLGTLAAMLRQRPPCPHEPARALRGVTALQQSDREPDGAPGTALRLSCREERLVGPGPMAIALEHSSGEVRGDGEALQIHGRERSFAVRRDEPIVGVAPRPALERLAGLLEKSDIVVVWPAPATAGCPRVPEESPFMCRPLSTQRRASDSSTVTGGGSATSEGEPAIATPCPKNPHVTVLEVTSPQRLNH